MGNGVLPMAVAVAGKITGLALQTVVSSVSQGREMSSLPTSLSFYLLCAWQVSHIECVSHGEAQEFVEDDQAHN